MMAQTTHLEGLDEHSIPLQHDTCDLSSNRIFIGLKDLTGAAGKGEWHDNQTPLLRSTQIDINR
jgi:hypothetical protein